MRAGKLRYRIDFYKKQNIRDDYSGYLESYSFDFRTRCDVKWLSGGTQIVNDQVFPTSDITFTIRYKSDVDETMRIKFRDEVYEIDHISVMEPKVGMIITCSKLLEM